MAYLEYRTHLKSIIEFIFEETIVRLSKHLARTLEL